MSAFYVCCINSSELQTRIQVNFRLDILMGSNDMSPDQTAPLIYMSESFQVYSWIQDFEADFP